ncbi:WhiB family transcriptional regulator [Streptomyces sp. NPDC001982]|uniref:WhiB family transcriptional regulator n=1 Tax=Streptomyces sp. NPDC001982 TaxID=3154405 RepID=UPI00331F1BEF
MSYTGQIPDTAVRRLDWMARMACRNEDPDLFFDSKRQHEARIVCVVRCPVRAQCLAHVKDAERGVHRDDRDGVIAGLTYDERWRLDAEAKRRKEDAPPLKLDGTEPCGTYPALLRHLWLNEPVDGVCWSGEVRRNRENHGRTPRPQPAPKPAAAAPAHQPKPVQPRGATQHERRVYTLWSTGLSDMDIARRMAVSVPSVKRVRGRLGLLPNQQARTAS